MRRDALTLLNDMKRARGLLKEAIKRDSDSWNYSLNEQTSDQNDAFAEILDCVDELIDADWFDPTVDRQ